jgi:hypothetical protein
MRSCYIAIPLPKFLQTSSTLRTGNWPSGASLERSVHPAPGSARMLTRIPLIVQLVGNLTYRYLVKAKNLGLWTDNFLMKLQAWPLVPWPKVQGGEYKASLAPFCTLIIFLLRMMELPSQRRVSRSGHLPPTGDGRRGKSITKRRNGRSRGAGRGTIRSVT